MAKVELISPVVESGAVLKALETAIPTVVIEQAIGETESLEQRKRALPSHLVVCLLIAMSLWSKASMKTVLKNLVDGLTENGVRVGKKGASTMQVINYGSQAASRVPGDELPVPSSSAPSGHTADSWSFSWRTASDGGRWNSIRRAR